MSGYRQTHKVAKGIVFFLVIVLLILSRRFDTVYLDIAAVAVWMWGTNPVGYLLESFTHSKHDHDKL